MDERRAFSNRLRGVMDDKGICFSAFYEKINKQKCTITKDLFWEYYNGLRMPSTETLKIICETLNVSADYLIGITVKKKAMISQPMNGKTDEEIVADRNRAIEYLESLGYEVVNTLFTDEWYSKKSMEKRGVVQIPLCFLAKSLENMSKCHVAYFVKGWENARGCKIEHDCAVAYGVEVIEE